MDFESPLYPATLIKRYARVLADVRLENGDTATVFCSNTTKLKGIADPDVGIFLSYCPNPNRRLQLVWELANVNGTLVGVNMGRQDALITEAVLNGLLYELGGYETIEPDTSSACFDLLLTPAAGSGYPPCRVAIAPIYEKKGTELLFPDTVDVANHHVLNHLASALQKGERAVLILLAQRNDCPAAKAQWMADPAYLVDLKDLYENKGLEIICCGCSVSEGGLMVTERLPFLF